MPEQVYIFGESLKRLATTSLLLSSFLMQLAAFAIVLPCVAGLSVPNLSRRSALQKGCALPFALAIHSDPALVTEQR